MGERGEVIKQMINTPIVFNGNSYHRIEVEIDHINFGLDKKTKNLNTKKRSDFGFGNVLEFLKLLNDEFFLPVYTDGETDFYAVELRSPIKEKYFGKLFRLVFSTQVSGGNAIKTITLFRLKERV